MFGGGVRGGEAEAPPSVRLSAQLPAVVKEQQSARQWAQVQVAAWKPLADASRFILARKHV